MRGDSCATCRRRGTCVTRARGESPHHSARCPRDTGNATRFATHISRFRMRRRLPVVLGLLLATAMARDASARAVVDPRMRGAVAVRADAVMAPRGGHGEWDVFIRGAADPRMLKRAGARVRTTLPGLCTAYVPADALDRIAAVPGVTSIRLAARVEVELSASAPTTGATLLRGPGPAFAGLNGRGVLIGSVDTGVDFHHGDFRDSTGATRFVAIWDQVAPGAGNAAFPYGRMWTAAEIDAGTCIEGDSVGHGTHVLGIAAGDGSQTGGGVPAF